MENLIKSINEVLGVYNPGSQLGINFYNDGGIVFYIYEQEIPIVIDKDSKKVYLDCETSHNHLTADMLNELSQIVRLIEESVDVVVSCVPSPNI